MVSVCDLPSKSTSSDTRHDETEEPESKKCKVDGTVREKLSDLHINLALVILKNNLAVDILKKQFQHLNCLQYTLLQAKNCTV